MRTARIGNQRNRGVTLVELMVAMAILAIASMGLVSAFLSGSTLSQLTSEENLAVNAARAKMAEMRETIDVGYSFGGQDYTGLDAMVARYRPSGGDRSFAVAGLDVQDGKTSVGEVILYLDEGSVQGSVPVELGGSTDVGDGAGHYSGVHTGCTTVALTTDADGYQFGTLDLDGNAASVDNLSTPTAGTYAVKMVPVEVRISWKTRNGPITMRRFMMIARIQ